MRGAREKPRGHSSQQEMAGSSQRGRNWRGEGRKIENEIMDLEERSRTGYNNKVAL
jgi:hypothetical protein